jgi:hypothetical protein
MSNNTIHRALVEKLGGRNVSEFVGNAGDLFWDPDTGNMRIADGETVGGLSIAESTPWAEDIFVGPWVNFVRPADSPEVVDVIIPDVLEIARDPQAEGAGSIYNTLEDEDGNVDSPYFTSWNTDGWGDLTNIKNRYYETLNDANDGGGWKNIHYEWVMKVSNYGEGAPNRYFLVRFLNWDSGGIDDANGAFAWTRREINTNAFFARADYNNEQDALDNGDVIAPHLVLTRENGGGLFNYGYDSVEDDYWETNYGEDRSPKNTLWNWDGWDNLQNLKSRQFMLFGDLVYSENWYGKVIVGREFIMHDTVADEYYAIKFTRWQKVTGGVDYPGFSYIRRKIDLEKLAHGLTFEDATTQTTAYSTKIGGTIPPAPHTTSTVEERWINADDIGKLIILDGDTTNEIRIPDTSTLQWPIGGVVSILNMTGNTVYIYKDNDDENGTIYGNGTGDSSTAWEVPDTGGHNLVTLMKIKQGMDGYFNDYLLSGAGIQVN